MDKEKKEKKTKTPEKSLETMSTEKAEKADSADATKPSRKRRSVVEDTEAVAAKKKMVSIKSSAYHCAKNKALKDGMSKEEALALAKAVPCRSVFHP